MLDEIIEKEIPKEAWTGKKVNYFFLRISVVNHLSILIKKIEQSLRKNPRSVPLLDTVEMSYSMRRSCTKITCRERNRKNKNHNTQCLMISLKNKFQRYQKIKMFNNMIKRYLKLLQVLLEYLPG
jgi:hypothetical protein